MCSPFPASSPCWVQPNESFSHFVTSPAASPEMAQSLLGSEGTPAPGVRWRQLRKPAMMLTTARDTDKNCVSSGTKHLESAPDLFPFKQSHYRRPLEGLEAKEELGGKERRESEELGEPEQQDEPRGAQTPARLRPAPRLPRLCAPHLPASPADKQELTSEKSLLSAWG